MPFRLSNRGLVTIAAMVGIALAAVDVTIVGTAMPTIVGTLGGLGLYSWVFSIYLLTGTVTVPLYGKLADLYGRKPVFVYGALTFLLGSVLCGLAQSMEQLILFRAIQGFGTGALIPVTQTIAGDLYPIEQRAKIQGAFSSVWGIAGIVGPAIGAFIVEQWGWRWIFLINLPIGIIATAMVIAFLHETEVRKAQIRLRDLDFTGAILLTVGLLGLLGGLLEIGQARPWLSLEVLGPFAIAIVCLSWFWRTQYRVKLPIVPPMLLRQPLIRIGAGVGMLAGAILLGLEGYLPLYVQGALLGSAATTGVVLAAMSICWPIGSTIGGRLMLKTGFRVPPLAGGIVLSVGSLGLMLLTFDRPPLWTLIVLNGLCGFGQGLINACLIIAIQNAVDWAQRGVATALYTFARSVGQMLGAALLGSLFTALLLPRLAESGIQAPGGAGEAAAQASSLLDPAARDALSPEVLEALQNVVGQALNPVFITIFVLALIAVLLASRLPDSLPARTAPEAATPSQPQPAEARSS